MRVTQKNFPWGSTCWKWAADGPYNTKSAYIAQFLDTIDDIKHTSSRGHIQKKNRIFTWILIQNKILVADNLSDQEWLATPQDRVLCNGLLETGFNFCLVPLHKRSRTKSPVGSALTGLMEHNL
jgi:hypothetical protein